LLHYYQSGFGDIASTLFYLGSAYLFWLCQSKVFLCHLKGFRQNPAFGGGFTTERWILTETF
jgi:hypothetical protein